jgi:hypothetical protein
VSKEGYRISPENQEAVYFCEDKWDSLRRGEWPEPTPPEENPPVYRWKLRFGKKEKDMITSDIAGETWRAFIEENIKGLPKNLWQSISGKMEALPDTLSQLVRKDQVMTVEKMLKDASSIFFILDLGHIIDEDPGYEHVKVLPYCLHLYMKKIHKTSTPIVLVLSKTDKYKYLYEQEKDWKVILEKYIPYLPPYIDIIPVAAVAKTTNGFPAEDFPSEGLDKLYESFWNNKTSFIEMPGFWTGLGYLFLKHLFRFLLGG